MADLLITELDAAGALAAADEVEVQQTGTETVKTTLSAVGDFALTRIDSATAGSGLTGSEKIAGFSSGVKSYTATQLQTFAHKFPVEALPSAPASGLECFAKDFGEIMLGFRTPRGIQRIGFDISDSNYFNINTNNGSSVNSIGSTVTTSGTISHPATSGAFGRRANVASATTGNTAAAISAVNQMFMMGNAGVYGGFLYSFLGCLPDASYNSAGASTGTRIFNGLTSGTYTAACLSDDPAGSHVGFFRCHVNGGLQHTNWQIMTRDGTTINIVDTGVPFAAETCYEMRIYNPNDSTTVYWALRNVSTQTAWVTGSTSTNVPGNTQLMRAGFGAGIVQSGTAVNIAVNQLQTIGYFGSV